MQVLPGLMYADDIVLVAERQETMQGLVGICGGKENTLDLNFSRNKSGMLVHNDAMGEPLEMQVTVIETVEILKYLGVWLNEERKYLNERGEIVVKKGKNVNIMKHKALWNFNKYEVVREVWKAAMVPGFTFGNAVLGKKFELQSSLESRQKSVGRLASGAHGNAPNGS